MACFLPLTRTVADDCQRAQELLSAALPDSSAGGTSLARMTGQMIMIGFDGRRPGEGTADRARQMIMAGEIGGVLLLSHNLGTVSEIRRLVAYLMPETAALPPLIAVDQEGGAVQRLAPANGFTPIPSAYDVSRMGVDAARQIYRAAAKELKAVGVNVNFGPVVDLNRNPRNWIIGGLGRSFGRTPDAVLPFARAFIDAHNEQGIITSVKHFPGHGSSRSDSHKEAVDTTETWDLGELDPYQALITERRVEMVMSSHISNANLAAERAQPAALSEPIITGLLRKMLNYSGVVVTDDLRMGAIAQHYQLDTVVLESIKAGHDILLFSEGEYRGEPLPGRVPGIICSAILNGELTFERIRLSYDRVQRLKREHLGRGRTAGARWPLEPRRGHAPILPSRSRPGAEQRGRSTM
jgi:beta-N-acetylhexosaminidase